ncbi:NAD-dependent dehydratase [Pseudoclavibacter endophyticus]|uniref:NAD(P)H-binding protein n=1 Tax=Pseudoclavibacter endophyticus TaxID=1778590 RepID=A0A6H9WTK5_9MICO|nr:NAD(P)H-binding protein [Pseudoclavibacter endophyticus]KAB1649744.1 NAD(P)H-binding protein [Pseudoclavibacter endophyticus]GGA60086.1 NAD-dependent dehydratase [Pseudoclavibacter endophyticus]
MSTSPRIVIVGGHGKVALLTAPKLASRGFSVEGIIRDPGQRGDLEAAQAAPVELDIESASVDELATAFRGAAAIVFAAGAGGGDPERTRAIDFEAAVQSMTAARRAEVSRFVLVSYARAGVDVNVIDPSDSFFPYAKAKHDADRHLRGTDLEYTILGPGRLTLEPATGAITIADEEGRIDGNEPGGDNASTSRENVAEVIAHVLAEGAAIRSTVNFYDGQTPIAQALATVPAGSDGV